MQLLEGVPGAGTSSNPTARRPVARDAVVRASPRQPPQDAMRRGSSGEAAQHAALGSRRRPTPGFACNLVVGGAEQKGSLLVRSSGTGTKTHHFGAAFA